MKFSVFFARFPYGGTEAKTVTNWMVETVLQAKADPRISEVYRREYDDTPITMTRNRALLEAKVLGADLVCFVDSDMDPDLKNVSGAQPFFRSSLDFLLGHHGPCVVGAPYCGPPPHENIYVFRWGKKQSDHPNPDLSIDQFGREDAAQRAGFEEVAALPTGLMLIDMRAVPLLAPPWFDYEWSDPPFNTQKATTEDVYFSRNLALAGVPQYVNWDAWAGHWKRKSVGKPVVLTTESVREQYRDAIIRGHSCKERLIDVGCGRPQLQVKNGQILGQPTVKTKP